MNSKFIGYRSSLLGFVLLAAACSPAMSPLKAVDAVGTKYPNAQLVFVHGASEAVSQDAIVAGLAKAATDDSNKLLKLLQSEETVIAVSGESTVITGATIERAAKDVGSVLPKNKTLVIVGDASDYTKAVKAAGDAGIKTEFVAVPTKK